MEFRKIEYQRSIEYKVPAEAARELRAKGFSLRQIRERLGLDVSLSTISRSIQRAEGKHVTSALAS